MDILNKFDIPCGPILSMKEIAEEPSLRATGTVVEVDHPKRGKYLTVGNPIKLSDSPTEVKRSPLLGEHTDEVLAELGYSASELAALRERRSSDPTRTTHQEDDMSKDKAKVRQILDAVKAAGRDVADRPRRQAGLRRLRHPRAPGRRRHERRRGAEARVGDGLPGRDEDRLARHPAQDRGRRRARRREERPTRRPRPTTRSSPTPRSTRPTRRSSACRSSR